MSKGSFLFINMQNRYGERGSAVQQVGDRLVDQEGDHAMDGEFQRVERQKRRHDQCHDLCGGHVRVERCDDYIAYNRHRQGCDRTDDDADDRAFAGLVPAVDQCCRHG